MPLPDARFDGSIPLAYDRYLAPVLFLPCARDMAERAAQLAPSRLLEVACGTGVLTRCLRERLPNSVEVVATDLNDAMVAHARSMAPGLHVHWRQADAQALPFPSQAFDVVTCQFGLMFVPDKPLALREVRRVLRQGGTYLCSVWDRLEQNPPGAIAQRVVASLFPDDPPQFFQTPYGLHDLEALERMLAEAGFRNIRVDRQLLQGESPTALAAATGLLTGTPMAHALAERGITDPRPVISRLAAALAEDGGDEPFRTPLRMILITATA